MNEWEKFQSEFDRLANEMRRAWLAWPAAVASVAQWSPAMNAYRLADELILCFDLAGMRREDIHVRVEGRRLTIAGCRPAPEPPCNCRQQMQTLALEIDAGSFERTLELPAAVDATAVTATYRDGLLWIKLPLRPVTHVIQPREDESE